MIWILFRKYDMDVNWNMWDMANNEHLCGTTSWEGDNKTKPKKTLCMICQNPWMLKCMKGEKLNAFMIPLDHSFDGTCYKLANGSSHAHSQQHK